uniref:RING-type domain-containing protein n=1 Tax=Ciona savignyi TaxID=51511 RepID=H2Z5K0_CIOSA
MASASKSFKNKLEDDLLTCPICCSLYSDPRVLKCQHSFCRSCLERSVKASRTNCNSINCAVCRKTTPLGRKRLQELPKNYVIIGLSQMVKDHKGNGGSSVDAEEPSMKENVVDVQQLVKVFNKKSISSKKKSGKDKNDNKLIPNVMDGGDDSSDFSTSASDFSSEFTPTDSDQSGSSGSSSGSSGSSGSSSASTESSSEDCDDSPEVLPPTPTMKSSLGIKIGMKVYVFSSRGKPHPGVVRVLEKFKRKPPGQTRVYAGVQLEKENTRLTTDDIEDMDDSYLFNWLMDFDEPCTVVRVDQCCPAKIIESVMK